MADNQQAVSEDMKQKLQDMPVKAVPSGSNVLKLQFGTLSGTKTFSYNYADAGADRADVRALASAMIANGSIFQDPPLVAKAAWVETKTINEFDLG